MGARGKVYRFYREFTGLGKNDSSRWIRGGERFIRRMHGHKSRRSLVRSGRGGSIVPLHPFDSRPWNDRPCFSRENARAFALCTHARFVQPSLNATRVGRGSNRRARVRSTTRRVLDIEAKEERERERKREHAAAESNFIATIRILRLRSFYSGGISLNAFRNLERTHPPTTPLSTLSSRSRSLFSSSMKMLELAPFVLFLLDPPPLFLPRTTTALS